MAARARPRDPSRRSSRSTPASCAADRGSECRLGLRSRSLPGSDAGESGTSARTCRRRGSSLAGSDCVADAASHCLPWCTRERRAHLPSALAPRAGSPSGLHRRHRRRQSLGRHHHHHRHRSRRRRHQGLGRHRHRHRRDDADDACRRASDDDPAHHPDLERVHRPLRTRSRCSWSASRLRAVCAHQSR